MLRKLLIEIYRTLAVVAAIAYPQLLHTEIFHAFSENHESDL